MVQRILILLLACLAGLAPSGRAADNPFAEIEQMTAKLASMTGFPHKRKVPAAIMTKAELERYLDRRVGEEVKPEEIRADEVALRMLGFIRGEFDLKKTMIDLLNEQAAAFYDLKKKRLFLMENAAGGLGEDVALAHELSHALADQSFDLDKFIRGAESDDDAHMARMAVMEGQATWLMSEWQAQKLGQTLVGKPEVVKLMSRAAATDPSEFPALARAPLFLQETLIFPYTKGLLFQAAVVDRLGKDGFARLFTKPPTTSQQILHPELYLEGRAPENIELPQLADKKGKWKTLSEGTLGELDHQVLLREYKVDNWDEIAAAWTGSRYRVIEDRKRAKVVLLYASAWTDEAAARRFHDAYRQSILPGKDGKRGQARLEVKGRFVTSVEGE